jgi:glutathione S-transferase
MNLALRGRRGAVTAFLQHNGSGIVIFGYTEAQIAGFFLTYGVGAFILFMVFIIGHLAWESKAGRFGDICDLSWAWAWVSLGFLAKYRDPVVAGKTMTGSATDKYREPGSMSLTIYGIAASRAVRPLWAAAELGLSFEHVETPYQGGATRTPDFLALNPNGRIPVLVDHRPEGEVVVWESMACALYLARHHGKGDGSDLAPATPREDAQALRWSFWSVTEVEKDALTVLMHRVAMPPGQRKPDLAEAAEKRLHVPLRVLEQHLAQQSAQGLPFLAAGRFTVADLCVASVLGWARPARALMEAFPTTRAWLERCLERPAHQALRAQARRH